MRLFRYFAVRRAPGSIDLGLILTPRGERVDGEAEATKGDLGGNHPGKLPDLRRRRAHLERRQRAGLRIQQPGLLRLPLPRLRGGRVEAGRAADRRSARVL